MYRLLEEGEGIQRGDECYMDGRWIRDSVSVGYTFNDIDFHPMRRKVEGTPLADNLELEKQVKALNAMIDGIRAITGR